MSLSIARNTFALHVFLAVVLAATTWPASTNAFQAISPLAAASASLSNRHVPIPAGVSSAKFQEKHVRGGSTPRQGSSRLYSSVALSTVLTALDSFWQTSPYTAAAIVCGMKASAADMIAQKRDYRKREEKERQAAAAAAASTEEEDSLRSDNTPVIYNPNATDDDGNVIDESKLGKKTDWKRNLAFLTYGSMYQGISQEFIYIHMYPVWFGSASTVPVVLSKVLFDLIIQTTFLTLPVAYLTKSVIYRYSFKEAIRRYIDDIRNHGLLKKYYLLWGPVQCITFSIIPEHWRVTFIAFVSFFWLIILSTIASRTKPSTVDAEPEAAAELIDECSFEDGSTCNIDG